ncbi:hypothetical protein BDR03DRAFT_972090 [Suillus americanus]|nr:hypothetical protein BDR03DRAFT_972090 [Suillus americanus]
MLSSELSSSMERLSDIAITEVHNFAITKRNHDARSTHVVTPDICVANTTPDNHPPSAPGYLISPFKAISKYKSQGSPSSRNDQGPENAVDPNCAHECHSGFTLTANGTSPITCLKDSPPVPAIDFTRLQFSSRNRLRFPLLRLEPVTASATAKVASRENGENSARPAASNHTPNQFAQDMPSAAQQQGKSAVPGACSSGNHEDTETALPAVTRQDTRVESSSSPGHLGEAIDSRRDTVTYHMDQLIRTRKRATGRDDVRFVALWESNAMWKGMRFWHENLKKPT